MNLNNYLAAVQKAIDLQTMAAILGAGASTSTVEAPEQRPLTADDLLKSIELVMDAAHDMPPAPFNGATLIRAGEDAYKQLEPLVDEYNDQLSLLPRVFLAKDRNYPPYTAIGINGFNVVFHFDGRK